MTKLLAFLPLALMLACASGAKYSDSSSRFPSSVQPSAALAPKEEMLATLKNFVSQFDSSADNETRRVRVLSLKEDKSSDKSLLFAVHGCRIEVIVLEAFDPITGKKGGFQLRRYTPQENNQDLPAESLRKILLLPPTGGENILDKYYADKFCTHGFQTAILERWDGDTDSEIDLRIHDRGAVRSLAAVRHAIEFLNPNPGQLGIFGTSVGGITSTLAMGYEPRITSAALIVTGIGMRQIIPYSHEENLTRLRAEREGIMSFRDDQAYAAAIADYIFIEPGDALPTTKVTDVWMMIATKDLTVPTATQLALKDLLVAKLGANHVQVDTHSADHIPTVVHSVLFINQIIQHFKDTLK